MGLSASHGQSGKGAETGSRAQHNPQKPAFLSPSLAEATCKGPVPTACKANLYRRFRAHRFRNSKATGFRTSDEGIEDTGIGIADDEIDSVFQRFYRNDKARFINPEGTGLGLAIARWIVDRHDADLTVSSALGEGTRFTITFHE